MSMTPASTTTTSTLSTRNNQQNKQLLCQECHKAACLYACPRCRFKSCSLHCCVSHKKRTGCNGKRDRTAFVPMAKMTDSTLQSDYHFLENVLNQVHGGKRLVRNLGVHVTNQHQQRNRKQKSSDQSTETEAKTKHPLLQQVSANKTETASALFKVDSEPPQKRQRVDNSTTASLPPKWRKLVERAQERNITLLLMPAGMERHKINTSCYIVKHDILCWRVEFIIHMDATTETILVAPKVSEYADLNEELRKLQQGGVECDNTDWTMLMKKLPCPSNKALYVELKQPQESQKITLHDVLCNMTVIEFPTIHVVMKQHLERYPRFILEM